ncbi:hypothetical protein RCH23_003248 [Cryobacterium sp. CAN_C3]|uniref:nitroreductase family deazaflavin-dependent oxidoreductase n=1 Tax=unclassified Cryobacterium TaxID=2649013 RepID=UPI0018CABA32|nr:nitroreductase family deazaflavin-dependent oxidoreductase [Cryobacterium sp. CAN_C3]MEC5155847.1 hypothetical protein [Cryobacterium sp. CAN_C3]
MARLAASGLTGWWLIRLDTVNPKSGTVLSLPLVTATVDGRRYVVSMLGQGARWVRNVLAADGHVVIRAGRRRDVVLTVVDVNLRAPILKNYLRRAPGGRPHIPVDKDAPLADFEAVAAAFPVFEFTRPNRGAQRGRDDSMTANPARALPRGSCRRSRSWPFQSRMTCP